MFRIDGPGATNDNKFTEGDPASGTRATVVTGEWLNAVQDELAQAIESDGQVLDKENSGQLKKLVVRRVIRVGSVSDIESLPPVSGYQVSLSGPRVGTFKFDSSDLSLKVAADIHQGIYIAPNTDLTGASGAWVRQVRGFVTPEMFGAVSDWDGLNGTDVSEIVQSLVDLDDVKVIRGTGNPYYFGNVARDATQILVTRDVDIDWNGSLLVCEGDNTQAGTDANLFTFQDCRMMMRNYEFLDTQFTLAGPSRGVMPAALRAQAMTTYGHKLTGFHIQKGQSLLTCSTADANLYRSIGIELRGTAEEVYYGFNAARNGDDATLNYKVGACNRLIFVYDVDGVEGDISLENGDPTSAQLLIANSGDGYPETKNIKVRATIGQLNGPVLITDITGTGSSGVYRNIDLDITFDGIGSNVTEASEILRIGDGSLSATEGTIDAENIVVSLNCSDRTLFFDNPVKVFTPSPNYGTLKLSGNLGFVGSELAPKNASGLPMGPTVISDGRYSKILHGDFTAPNNIASIPASHLSHNKINGPVTCKLFVGATANAAGVYTYAEYSIIGQLSGSGLLSLTSATEIFKQSTGTPVPVITIAASSDGTTLDISADGYTNAFSYLVASVQPTQ